MDIKSNYKEVKPVFSGYASLIQWVVSNDGMMIKISLKADSAVHPFRHYRTGQSGQRMHVSLSSSDFDGVINPLGAWEAMLSWWSDDPRSGMKVHIRLDDGPDGAVKHPLEGMQKGDELYIACWLVDDNDEVIENKSTTVHKGWNELKHAQQAHILCMDSSFQKWCSDLNGENESNENCISLIRSRCGIVSRKEFSEDNEKGLFARQQWVKMVSDYRSRNI